MPRNLVAAGVIPVCADVAAVNIYDDATEMFVIGPGENNDCVNAR